ncbi:hypothetical protein FACS189447_01000 [Spirochaetia bacterium]|nr:hypothetical protein FACS189447_01000 [Spirochaetia bacterium]
MKINITTFLSIFFFLMPLAAGAMDLELSGGVGNAAFDDDRTFTLGEESKAFTPQIFPLIKAGISGDIGDSFIYYAGYERDPILRNRVYANMGYKVGFLTLEMGPFLGVLNSKDSILTPGAAVGINLQFPGIVFLDLKASSTLGSLLEDTGDYAQNTRNLSLGFWVPYVVCSLNMETKEHIVLTKSETVTEDAVERYFFRADVYTKNVPYTVQVDLGYQNLSRSYSDYRLVKKNTKTDELKAFFLGLEAAYTLFPGFKTFFGGEIPLYSWSSGDMEKPENDAFLFRLRGGIVWTLPTKQQN